MLHNSALNLTWPSLTLGTTQVNAWSLIWNEPSTVLSRPLIVLFVVDEAGNERLKASLSTVTRLIFEGWSVKTYLTVFDASGAASD